MHILDARGPRPDATIRYADHADGVVDLHLPRPGPVGTGRPALLVLLHGGFWKAAYDRRHTRSMARALADRGLLVATPEYRRVGSGGGWPRTGDDVRRAFDAVLAHTGAAEALVTGHSAGGQLALWLAAADARVSRVVPLAPVCDLGLAEQLGLGGGAVRAFLGPSHATTEADPMVLFEGRTGPPVTVVHGRTDEEVPISLSRGLVARYPWMELVEIDAGHYEPIDPRTAAFTSYAEALTRAEA